MALNLTPPNVQTTIADKMGNMVHTWARWFQQLYTVLSNLDTLVTTIDSSLTAHIADTSPHSATSAATPDRLVLRDGAGRTKMVAPSASDDVAIKSTVDTVQTNLDTHTALASAHTLPTPVANNYIKRNAGNTAYDAVTITTIRNDLLTVDGSGSGLDADLLDGFSSSQTTTPSTVAVRNSSGNLLVANAVNSNHAVAFGQEASASAKGLITTGTQTIAGTKTFNAEKIAFPTNPGGLRFHNVVLADNASYTHDQLVTSGVLVIRSSIQSALYLADADAGSSSKLAGHANWVVGDPGAGSNQMGVAFSTNNPFTVWNRSGVSQTVKLGILVGWGTV